MGRILRLGHIHRVIRAYNLLLCATVVLCDRLSLRLIRVLVCQVGVATLLLAAPCIEGGQQVTAGGV